MRSSSVMGAGSEVEKKREAVRASLGLFAGSGQRGFGLLRDLGKRRLVMDGKVGQHLAVDVDRGPLQSVHERAVAHSLLAYRRVDPGDPQRAEFALLGPAVAIRVLPGLHHRFLRDPVDRVAPAAEAGRLRQDLLVPRARGHATLDSWHFGAPYAYGSIAATDAAFVP